MKLCTVLATGLFMTLASSIPAQDTGGASAVWTSTDPLIVRARQCIEAGELAAAHALLAGHSTAEADEVRDIIHRIRIDYALSRDQLKAKLQTRIHSLTDADLDRWTTAGQLQFRRLDGQVAYFRREPANLFRFCDEASQRRSILPPTPTFDLHAHLAGIIADAHRQGRSQVQPLRHHVTFEITVPPRHRAGQVARVWLPFPQEHARQTDVRLLRQWPVPSVLTPSGQPHRALYFEQKITDPKEPLRFGAEFEFISWAYYPILRDEDARPLSKPMPEFLDDRPPHIRFTPQIRETAARIVGSETNPLARARRLFEFVSREIRYNAEEEYAIIPSFCEHGLSRRRGDCGIQAVLFITLCRASGIPARWQSGWETRPPVGDMHDWAEIYVEPWGWLPVDVSYGLQQSDDPTIRYFYFGHQDSHRIIINLDYGRPLSPPKRSLRSEPADFQRGEVEIDGRNLYFGEWEHELTFTVAPAR